MQTKCGWGCSSWLCQSATTPAIPSISSQLMAPDTSELWKSQSSWVQPTPQQSRRLRLRTWSPFLRVPMSHYGSNRGSQATAMSTHVGYSVLLCINQSKLLKWKTLEMPERQELDLVHLYILQGTHRKSCSKHSVSKCLQNGNAFQINC